MKKKTARYISIGFLVASVVVLIVFVGIERSDVFDWNHESIPWTTVRLIWFTIGITLFLIFITIQLFIVWRNRKEYKDLEEKMKEEV